LFPFFSPPLDDLLQIFEISTKSGKRSFCGVHEFTANEGEIAIPLWMMENLNIADNDTVFVRRVNLPKATFLKFRPHSANFLALSNAKRNTAVFKKFRILNIFLHEIYHFYFIQQC
jgi:hypothetical protein